MATRRAAVIVDEVNINFIQLILDYKAIFKVVMRRYMDV